VPGHDERDFEFAAKFSLPIRRVLASETPLPFVGDGHLIDSEFLNGLAKGPAIERAISELEAGGLGQRQIQYKLRDWLFSRQRYWGEPFPIVHFESTNGRQTEALSLDELPVALPEVADYEPTEKGEPPLARVPEFVRYSGRLATGRAVGAASSGESARRETDTMPGSAGSSWYFLRYCDPHNDAALVDFEAQKYWMPVDLYVGGPEHSVGHLLYARFWQKVLFDAGLVSHDEPFQKLAHQGIILAPDGQRMSKSRGNVVNPDELRERYGADALRAFILFLGPLERDKPWQENGIDGVARFLERLWRWVVSDTGQLHLDGSGISGEVETLLHKTIKKVTEDFESLSFNTAISAMMIYLNELYRTGCRSASAVRPLIQLLAPIAPHLCEELWERTAPLATPLAPDQSGLVSLAAWPTFDPEKAIDRTITLGVQVNGKSRGTIDIAPDASEEDAVQAAMKIETVRNALGGQNASKVIYKAGRILNLIAAKG
jgi:leucyl-tRNA synthetase